MKPKEPISPSLLDSFPFMPTPSRLRFSDQDQAFISSFLYGKRSATLKGYVFELSHFFQFLSERKRNRVPSLEGISLYDIQDYMNSIGSKSSFTQLRALAVIRSLFSFAERSGYLQSNPALHCAKIRGEKNLSDRILTREEVFKMIDLEKNQRNRLIIKTLYVSALRVSELSQLRWSDLQWSEDGRFIQALISGKGGKKREIFLEGSLVSGLTEWRTLHQCHCPFVFSSREESKGPIHPSRILKIVRSAAFRAGIKKFVSPHWLRHSHASHALDGGAPLYLVRDTLGHSSISTTGLYLHARPDDSSGLYLAI